MRDPKRIDEMLALISQAWKASPDLRFQQLIYILQSDYSEANDGFGKVESEEINGFKKVGYELFNLEDDAFKNYLIATLNHNG